MAIGPIQLLRLATPGQRRTLLAAALGWMLDAFDAMLYALVLTYVMRDLGMSKATSGLLYTLTLLASGIGGLLFGWIADRIGRKRALMLSILTYSICSFASGLSTTVLMLAGFRCVLGLGMGGEWNTGATLVAETWPDELRAKAIALVQSSWAIGYALAALVAGVVLRFGNWRFVFFVGILPAVVTLWIRKSVPESQMWLDHYEATNPKVLGVATQHDSAIGTRTGMSAPHKRLGLLFLVLLAVVFYSGLEVSDTLAQPLAQIGKLARTEEQERDAHNQNNMQRLEQTLTHNFLHGDRTDSKPVSVRNRREFAG
jgi:MFS family permease